MKRKLLNFYITLYSFGFDPIKTFHSIKGIPSFVHDYVKIKKLVTKEFKLGKLYPCVGDRYGKSGTAKGHYFHQDLLIASKIYQNKPIRHMDVGSRIDGFVAHVASFREIEVMDIRPLENNIKNIIFRQADMMKDVPPELIESCDSLSCLHALEHFGLGRYGDPINVEGYILGYNNLCKMLKPKGILYLSVPIGPQRIEFNAHRVFSVRHLLNMFKGKFEIEEFSFVDDKDENLHKNVSLEESLIDKNFGCKFGCGIFCLKKI
jgi:hypothetical protein